MVGSLWMAVGSPCCGRCWRTRLHLVLALDDEVEQVLGVDRRLAAVGDQPDQARVPLVRTNSPDHLVGKC